MRERHMFHDACPPGWGCGHACLCPRGACPSPRWPGACTPPRGVCVHEGPSACLLPFLLLWVLLPPRAKPTRSSPEIAYVSSLRASKSSVAWCDALLCQLVQTSGWSWLSEVRSMGGPLWAEPVGGCPDGAQTGKCGTVLARPGLPWRLSRGRKRGVGGPDSPWAYDLSLNMEPRPQVRGSGLSLAQWSDVQTWLAVRGPRVRSIAENLIRMESRAQSEVRVGTQAEVGLEVRGQDRPSYFPEMSGDRTSDRGAPLTSFQGVTMTVKRTRAGPGAWPLSGWEPRSLVCETWVVVAPASISIVLHQRCLLLPPGPGVAGDERTQ